VVLHTGGPLHYRVAEVEAVLALRGPQRHYQRKQILEAVAWRLAFDREARPAVVPLLAVMLSQRLHGPAVTFRRRNSTMPWLAGPPESLVFA